MLLTVILPYFKKKRFIKKTLDSIIYQTFKNFELIIVYDQKDKSDLKYIKKILAKKIKYKLIINKKNLGVGKSRNIGIKNSNSKYIAFCDADDVWSKKKSEIQLRLMEKKKLNFSHTDYNLINEEDKIIGKMNVKQNLTFKDLINSCDIALSSVMIRRSFINKNLLFGLNKTKEDYLLWLKISRLTKIYGINKTLLSWRKTKNSLSSDLTQKLIDAYYVYKKVVNKNFLITIFFVIRLSINFLIKKLKQKVI